MIEDEGEDRFDLTSLSRLDRLYSTLRSVDLLDMRPIVDAIGSATDPTSLSDHIPVRAVLSLKEGDDIGKEWKIPEWILRHSHFGELCSSGMDGIDDICSDPFGQAVIIGGVMKDAQERL